VSDDDASRLDVLRRLGASEGEAAELLAYGRLAFARPASALRLPLEDEPFAAAWAGYAAEAQRRGAWTVLRERLPQLRFPIAPGVAETPAYRAAVRRGEPPPEGPGLRLEAPETLRLFLHRTPAGRIPVVVAEHRADFVALVRAFIARGEPSAVPDSQGAVIVGGYNNWDRVAGLRTAFERGELEAGGATSWVEAFAWVRERKELYQDCFILLSGGAYSGVPAAEMGMGEAEWRRVSLEIRLEHECAHYFTRRGLGVMRRSLHDELIADYAGIVAAAGRFRADWFLRFLGLEGVNYRSGGRLENYREGLSDGAFAVLQSLVRRAASAVETVDRRRPPSWRTSFGRARMMLALAAQPIEALAAEDGAEQLTRRLRTRWVRRWLRPEGYSDRA
jgi:hypothetical protein